MGNELTTCDWKETEDHIFKETHENCEGEVCGKPHNNGEDTCNECLAIKEGI